MPFYYHLKFELYPTSDPSSKRAKYSEDPVWLPSLDSSVFDNLPSHPRKLPSHVQKQRDWQETKRFNTENTYQQSEDPCSHCFCAPSTGVIDCGASRPATSDDPPENPGRKTVHVREKQWRKSSRRTAPPGFATGLEPRLAARDWRFGRLSVESYDLVYATGTRAIEQEEMGPTKEHVHATPAASLGPNLGGPGQATKARYLPSETKNTELGWGIVHLYRENNETNALNTIPAAQGSSSSKTMTVDNEEGTILCIPSVPCYLSPSDFLGFVGEKWRCHVSHYRMVMTSRMNRYMVLMKFRCHEKAKEWREETDGRAFNSMEAEICHVTFIKSIIVETPSTGKPKKPDASGTFASSSASVVNSLKPFPPPTPDLIELPTCAVCLERMDDTTGLMTILCQHVFHCTCLQTWTGSGCPVCRATNPKSDTISYDPNDPFSKPFGSGVSNLCSVCDSASDLWICLICGNVGCGRYKGGHAKGHWKETAHSFSLELETQHVWDYAGDIWVHRLLRDKGDGKVVELPSNTNRNNTTHQQGRSSAAGSAQTDEDVVPRAKLDSIGMEYTHLLTGQLESQRVYFEEMVSKAADKASKAAAAAEKAVTQSKDAVSNLATLREEHRILRKKTLPTLERDLERERSRANKASDLARNLNQALQEEKKVGEGLMGRIEHLTKEVERLRTAMDEVRGENAELKEMNRDLTMFISGQEKLKSLENEGKIDQAELEDGMVSVPEDKKKSKGKGRTKK